MSDRQITGEELRAIRQKKELTQQSAAVAFGVCLRTWTLWEKKSPSRMGLILLEREGWI